MLHVHPALGVVFEPVCLPVVGTSGAVLCSWYRDYCPWDPALQVDRALVRVVTVGVMGQGVEGR